tara:strand:- start:1350 stop:2420 length:1071 start_codon:yes stop_codon:yes gene_type:complete
MSSKTPFYSKHIEAKANMVDFFGFSLPIYYDGIKIEHKHVRDSVGVFDVSHMGQIILEGEKVFNFLQTLTTNDLSKIETGSVQYSCMTNKNGMVLDDLLVYKLSDVKYMLVVNASNTFKILNWLESNNSFLVNIEDITMKRGLLAVQGPKAISLLQNFTDFNLSSMKSYTFKILQFGDIDNILISSTGYTGSGGFEIYGDKEKMLDIWNLLFSLGEYNLKPIGLGARDTLRLEMGFCLYGNELSENISPLEAKLNKIVAFDTEFIGSKVLRNSEIKKELIAFELLDRGIPRNGYIIVNEKDQEIGFVSSGTMSPSLNKPIGLGFLYSNSNFNDIFVVARNRKILAKIVKLPFYKKK